MENRRTILVIDDDEEIRGLIGSALDAEKYLVVGAMDGAEGLERVRKDRPDLVVLDIEMPRMNGREVLAAIRHDLTTTATLVVMLTSVTGVGDRKAGLELGADAYIEKPFHAGTLARRIEYLIDLRAGAAAALVMGDKLPGPGTTRPRS